MKRRGNDDRGLHVRDALIITMMALSPILCLYGCVEQTEEVPRSTEEEEIPDQEIEGYVLRETRQGRLRWILHSDYMAKYSEEKLIRARDLKIDFMDDEGEVTSVLVAEEGEVNSESRNMIARGNVRIVTTQGDSLMTDEIEWLSEKELIRSDRRVVLIRKGNRIESVGMESDPALKHIQLKQHVTGSFPELDVGEEDF